MSGTGDDRRPPAVPGATSSAELLLDLLGRDAPERERALAELREVDPARAARLERWLAADVAAGGPLERLRTPVAERSQRLLAASEPAPPGRVGAWRLVERLGVGGMGDVWLGERVEGGFAQAAAVKLVRAGMASEEVLARFRNERQVLARLEHPAIARLLDGGVAPDGRPWFAMERVVGSPITAWARERGASVEDRLRLVATVCDAVDFAHRNLVVHRDLKPSNLLVTAAGEPKLLDFGLAKLLDPGADPTATRFEGRALTPAYAAPEQVLGEPVTTATDVYAIGVLLYELLTGSLPYVRSAISSAALADEVRRETVERPSVRVRRLAADEGAARAVSPRRLEGDLDAIVATALRREPERRYRSAAALAEDLRSHLAGRPVAARVDSWAYRARKFVVRHRLGVAAGAVALASLVAGLSAALVSAGRARREAVEAARTRDFLASLFGGVDPDLGPGPEAPARVLLALGERRIDAELGEEPRLAGDLYDALARASLALGAHDQARREAERARDWRVREFGDRSAEAAASDATLGAVATAQNRFAEGERLLRSALLRLAEAGRDEGVDAALVRVELATNLQGQWRVEEAGRVLERAHGTLERELAPGDRRRLRALVRYAGVLIELGELSRAKDLLDRAAVELDAAGAPPVTRALLEVERGRLLWTVHAAGESRAAADRAVAEIEKSLGPEHELLAQALAQRAEGAMADGDFESGRRDLERAIGILRRIDPEHPGTIPLRSSLAIVDQHSGQVERAIAVQRELVELATRRYGVNSAQEVEQRDFLAGALAYTPGGREEATRLFRSILALAAADPDAVPPATHTGTANVFARRLIDWGEPGAAIEMLEPVVARFAGFDAAFRSYYLVQLRLALARALLARGGPGDRERARREAELARADTADPDQRVNRPPDLLLAQLDFEDGDYAAVRDRLTQRIAGWEKAGHGGSATVADARLLLGRALIETGETEAARAALAAALASLESLRGPDHPATRQARAELERLEPGAGGAKAVSGSKR